MSVSKSVESKAKLSPQEEYALLSEKKTVTKADVDRLLELQAILLKEEFNNEKNTINAKHRKSVVLREEVIESGVGKGITIQHY